MGTNNEKKGRGIVKFLFFIAIICLVSGALLTYLTSPKYIINKALTTVTTNLMGIYENKKETGLTENFKIEGTLRMDLKSDYYAGLSSMNQEYASIAKSLNNLSNTTTEYTYIHDKKNEKRFINVNTKTNDKSILNIKQLIDNATEYYFIEGITNTYINNGNNNYFESLTTNTTYENIDYILEILPEIITNNLTEDMITTSYNNTQKIVTLTLKENNLLKLENNILKDLKNDDRANTILTAYNPDFSKTKITKKDVKNIKPIKVNIYLDKIFPQFNKIEIISGYCSFIYSIEQGKEQVIIKNEEDSITFTINRNKKMTTITITNQNNEELGDISITKTDTNTDIILHFSKDDTNYSLGYNNQITNLHKNKSYDSNTSISIKITNKDTTMLDGIITLEQKVSNDTKITEDISTSTLASTLEKSIDNLIEEKIQTLQTTLLGDETA